MAWLLEEEDDDARPWHERRWDDGRDVYADERASAGRIATESLRNEALAHFAAGRPVLAHRHWLSWWWVFADGRMVEADDETQRWAGMHKGYMPTYPPEIAARVGALA